MPEKEEENEYPRLNGRIHIEQWSYTSSHQSVATAPAKQRDKVRHLYTGKYPQACKNSLQELSLHRDHQLHNRKIMTKSCLIHRAIRRLTKQNYAFLRYQLENTHIVRLCGY